MLSDEQIWKQWLEWLPSAPSTDRPIALFEAYRKQLLKSGIPEAAASEQMIAIRRMMRTNAEGWQTMFNNIYANPTPGFKTDVNALLMSAVAGRIPGSALDLSAGQGRNSVYLAVNGWDVTAVDVSDEGLKIAMDNAQRAGATIHTVLQSISAFELGMAMWNLIVMTYAPAPLADPAYVARIHAALKPGGLVVAESFSSASGWHTAVDIDAPVLRQNFADFHILQFDEVVTTSDWDKNEVALVRFVAEKKG